MPRKVKEFKVVLYSSWLVVYMCEKSICMCAVCTQNMSVAGGSRNSLGQRCFFLALTLFPVPAQQIPKAMAAP